MTRVSPATTALTISGSVAVGLDALLTARLLTMPGYREQWSPVAVMLDRLGLAAGLVLGSMLALAVMAALAAASVKARPPLAAGAVVVLTLAVTARIIVVVMNWRLML